MGHRWVRVWGAWRASAKPASNPRAEPASLAHRSPAAHITHLGLLSSRAGCKPGVLGCQAGAALQAGAGPVPGVGGTERSLGTLCP